MRTEPSKYENIDPFEDLTPTNKITRWVAIVMAFIGVFVWFFKILF